MPRLNWWIITRSQRRQPEEREWSTCQIGEPVGMTGFYAYVTGYPDGSKDAPRADLRVTREGPIALP
jgi:hypothetical protein